jgi:hypothetical protein
VLERFLERLERERVLESTLVVITSDESAGYPDSRPAAELLSQNAGIMVVAYPGDAGRRVDERFAQSDAAVSIADAVGLAETSRLNGRSMFRTHDTGRRLVFGNLYLSKVGVVGPGDRLMLCEQTFEACDGYSLVNGDLFGETAPREVREREPAALRQALRALTWRPHDGPERQQTLLAQENVRLRSGQEWHNVFFGKYQEIGRPTAARVDLDFKAVEGHVLLQHDVVSNAGAATIYDGGPFLLLEGMSFAWKYSLDVRVPVSGLEFRMRAQKPSSGDGVLAVRAASLELEALPRGDAPAVRMRNDSFEVSLPSGGIALSLRNDHDFFRWSPCARRLPEGGVGLERCQDGVVVFGPYVPIPKGTVVSVDVSVDVESGRGTGVLDIAVSGAVVARSAPLVFERAKRARLTLELELDRTVVALETRLHLSQVTEPISASRLTGVVALGGSGSGKGCSAPW